MIYGEISKTHKFRFLSAGVPFPVVFSNRSQPLHGSQRAPEGLVPATRHVAVVQRDRSQRDQQPLGFKERYETNEWALMGRGDILLLHTDGLSDHRTQDQPYFRTTLEQTMREVKHLGAREIYEAIKKDVVAFGKPLDDISLVVIKLK